MRHFLKKGNKGRHRASGLPKIGERTFVTKVAFALGVTLVVGSLGYIESNLDSVSNTSSDVIVVNSSETRFTTPREREQAISRSEAREALEKERKRQARIEKRERQRLAERRAAAREAERQAAVEAEASAEATPHTHAPTPTPTPTPTVSTSLSDVKQYALNKVGSEQFSCLDALWTKESGWNHTATNPTSGAYGIPQSLPAEKMATAGSDWQTNPYTQIDWGLGYIRDAYGTPCGAWSHSQSVGWY